MMKRLVNYCLLTILSFVLFSCSSSVSQDTPEATVDAFIKAEQSLNFYCCPLKVSEQRDIHPQCCCNGIADDFSEGKPLS